MAAVGRLRARWQLLVLLGTLASPLAAVGHPRSSEYRNKQLKDVRKLQPGYWLKVAATHISTDGQDVACLNNYGQQYLGRWNKLQDTYCNTTAGAHSDTYISHVQCYAHPEADLSTCLVRNLLLTSTTAFLGSSPHSSELPQPSTGSIRLACNRTADPTTFLRGRLQSNEGSRAWLVTAPSFEAADSQAQHACSGAAAVAHPLMFVLRVDPQNAFHHLETVVSVFAALAVLQLDQSHLSHGLEVVIADDRQAGYFLHIWRRLSWPHPLRILRKQPFPDNTCFSKAIIAPYAAHAQSLLTYKAGSVDEVLCESVVLQATSRWLRQLFRDLLPLSLLHANRRAAADAKVSSEDQHTTTESRQQQTDSSGRHGDSTASSRPMQLSGAEGRYRDLAPLEPSPTQSAAPLELLYVVWLSRRRFEQQHAAELTSWQKARVLSQQQQQELVLGLQQAVLKWNAQTCVTAEEKECKARSVMFGLQVAELSEMSFYPDQLSLMMRAGVLVGVHGAGLANQIYMQPRVGAVVELWYGMESNTHYHNMAHMLGHAYSNVKAEDEHLDVGAVAAQVTAAMDAVAAKRAAAQAAAATSRKSPWWWQRGHSSSSSTPAD